MFKRLCTLSKGIPRKWRIYLHSALGLSLMLFFPLLPSFEPITPLGMKLLGIFSGMVYLCWTVSTIWPSLLGLLLIGLSGYGGEGVQGLTTVMTEAFGTETVLLVAFSMILFGGIHEAGCTAYISRWLLNRKIMNERPYIFLAIFYALCYLLALLVAPFTALLLLWPVASNVMDTLAMGRDDPFWPLFYGGMFFAVTIAQPPLAIRGARLLILNGLDSSLNYLVYIGFNIITSLVLMTLYLVILKFLLKPDVSKLKEIKVEQMAGSDLPPMTHQQKICLAALPGYLLMLLMPYILPPSFPGMAFLKNLGLLGVTLFWLILLCMVGERTFNFKTVACKQFNWSIFLLIVVAFYAAHCLTSDLSRVKPFLLEILTPILGDQSELRFVVIIFIAAWLIANFAGNAVTVIFLMPIVSTFSEKMQINPVPVIMGMTMMIFVAGLTPAASPHAGLMHGRKDLYTMWDIARLGLPLSLMTLIFYIFIGYPLAKILL